MLKYFFVIVAFLHGTIHLLGFAKAFGYGHVAQLTRAISKPAGVLWLVAAVLFVAAGLLFLLKKESWPVAALAAAVLSQGLIIGVWADAKFGTAANVLVLAVALGGWAALRFEAGFRQDVRTHLRRTGTLPAAPLTEADLVPLPAPVQRHLRYAGAVGRPKVHNMRLVFTGQMREKGKDWFPFRSVQYNFFDRPARLFFMKAQMFGTTVPGYHAYQEAAARMDIRLFGLFPVVRVEGPEMDKAETVTVFNDMCLMAPATLIDPRIRWQPIDGTSAKATFTNAGNTISAILYFSETGQLVNFTSDDRYAVGDMQQYRFSTPVKDYKELDGRRVPLYGEAVWHYPEGPFPYGRFHLETIDYNVPAFQE